MTDKAKIVLPDVPELAPEPPPRGPWVWAKENLFSTPASIVLTLFGAAVAFLGIRGMMGFITGEGRKWGAITTNFRLLAVEAYPDEHLWRIWVSVGIIAVLVGFSLAFWRSGGLTEPRKLLGSIRTFGGVITLIAAISPIPATEVQIGAIVVGLVLIGASMLISNALGERAKKASIPTLVIAASIGAVLLILLWLIQVPVPEPGGAANATVLEKISRTTLGPWTLLYFATIAAYFVGVGIRKMVPGSTTRPLTVALWALSFPVIVLHLTRATGFGNIGAGEEGGIDMGDYLLIGVAFAVIGGAFIWFVSNPALGEWGRGLAGIGLVLAAASWLVAMPMVIRVLLLLISAFALAGPTFAGGQRRATIRYVAIWVIAVAVTIYLMLLAVGETTVETPRGNPFGGFFLTWIIAIAGISLSFPIGVIMALARTSTLPIFRLLATGYIEVIRGVPLITWLLVSVVVFPILFPPDVEFSSVATVVLFVAFFSGAYLAENVRGGLQSIGKGQNEAANALGMTTLQRTVFITLPQALRAVIPALVGQVIAIFKDTSLVAIVGLFDLLNIARQVIPNQSGGGDPAFNFLGSQREALIAAAVFYWIFTYTFSRASQRLEKRLGVGTR